MQAVGQVRTDTFLSSSFLISFLLPGPGVYSHVCERPGHFIAQASILGIQDTAVMPRQPLAHQLLFCNGAIQAVAADHMKPKRFKITFNQNFTAQSQGSGSE